VPRKLTRQSNGAKEDSISTKESLIQAAIELFGSQGYDGTGVQQIVDMASVTKGAFYHIFESKMDLLRFIHDRFLDHMLSVIDRIAKENRSPTDALKAVIREILLTVAQYQAEVAIFIREGRFLEGKIFEEVREKRDKFTGQLVEILRTGVDRGELRDLGDPQAVAFGIVGLCSWPYSWYKPEDGPMDRIADIYTEFILGGLVARPDLDEGSR
jgi:TetR/AcrR family transcriptional regulator, cholesterol catabolism regulator